MSDLLGCPFCGGEAEIWCAHENRTAWIACMGRCSVLVSKEYKTDAEAIAAWNTRAPLTAQDALAVPQVAALLCANCRRPVDTWSGPDDGTVWVSCNCREDFIPAIDPRRMAMVAALHRIAQWADAYPVSAFPEPDFAKAAKVLAGSGVSLDAISASNMRHVIKGVGEIARAALAQLPDTP